MSDANFLDANGCPSCGAKPRYLPQLQRLKSGAASIRDLLTCPRGVYILAARSAQARPRDRTATAKTQQAKKV